MRKEKEGKKVSAQIFLTINSLNQETDSEIHPWRLTPFQMMKNIREEKSYRRRR